MLIIVYLDQIFSAEIFEQIKYLNTIKLHVVFWIAKKFMTIIFLFNEIQIEDKNRSECVAKYNRIN